MEDSLSLAPDAPNDALDDLDEPHLDPRAHLDKPHGTMLTLPVPPSHIVRRKLNLGAVPLPIGTLTLGLRVALSLGTCLVALGALGPEEIVGNVLVVPKVDRSTLGRGIENPFDALRDTRGLDGNGVVADRDEARRRVVGDEEHATEGRKSRLWVDKETCQTFVCMLSMLPREVCARTLSIWMGGNMPWNKVLMSLSWGWGFSSGD